MITPEMLENHRLWLANAAGGERLEYHADLTDADLTDANLAYANLTDANLTRADLARANLTDADLAYANLTYADLTYANLTGANLTDADLTHAVGVLHPPINDPRGYRCVAVWHSDGWRIAAGCRWLTVVMAREHWGEAYTGDRAIGNAYLAAIEWLDQQPPFEEDKS